MTKSQQYQDEQAKLALAYMARGTPPYQAARKTGFMRVTVMQDAIRTMESRMEADGPCIPAEAETLESKRKPATVKAALEATLQPPAVGDTGVPKAGAEASPPPEASISGSTRPYGTQFRPLAETIDWAVNGAGFVVKRLAAVSGYPAAIRLLNTDRPTHYLQFRADILPDLLSVLAAAASMNDLVDQKKEVHVQ